MSALSGAGAIEFQNVMKICIEECFCWNVKEKNKRFKGMSGDILVLHWTLKEQFRRTLHIHFLFLLKYI